MKHLLLDVNIVVDACTNRSGSVESVAAIAKAKAAGLDLWIYAGSVQTLEFVLASELVRLNAKRGFPPSYTRPCSTQGQTVAGKLLQQNIVVGGIKF